MNIKFLVEAYCLNADDVNLLSERFDKYYSRFFKSYSEEENFYDEDTQMARFVWIGYAADNFSEDDKDYLIKTTHHAEDLYEDSDIEYAHIEICMDGKWYGRLPRNKYEVAKQVRIENMKNEMECLSLNPRLFTDEQIKEIFSAFEDNLADNDMWNEIYRNILSNTVKDYAKDNGLEGIPKN